MRDAPPIFFLRHQKENAPRPVEKKKCSAGRSAPAQTSCRRRGKAGSPLRQSETETRCPWGDLWPGEVWDTFCADFRCRWLVADGSFCDGPMRASAPTTAQAARSEAERAEREAGQMRSCTPLTSAPAPRESAVKYAPYPAAPVRRSSQIRRHHLTPTLVQRGGTYVPERDKKRSFLLDRARPVFFSARPKRKWGVHCPAINIAVIRQPNGWHSAGRRGRRPLHPPPERPLQTGGRHHRAARINIPDGSAVPTAACCSPECAHSRPLRRSP